MRAGLLVGALVAASAGCSSSMPLGEYRLLDLARRQEHIADHLGPPTKVGEFTYQGRRIEIQTRVLPPHSLFEPGWKETLEQTETLTFRGAVDSDGSAPLWMRAPIQHVAGVGALAVIRSDTDTTSGLSRDEVAIYDPSRKDVRKYPPYGGFGWRSFADYLRVAGERAFICKRKQYTSGVDFEPSFAIVADAGRVRRFTDMDALAVQTGGRWTSFLVDGSHERRQLLPDGPICFFAREVVGTATKDRRAYLLAEDLRLEEDVAGVELENAWIDGWSCVLTTPSPVNPNFRAIRRPDGSTAIPDGSLGIVPLLHPKTSKVTCWLVAYPSEVALHWGWATADLRRWSGPIWLDARVATSKTVYRPVLRPAQVIYHSKGTTYDGGGVEGHTSLLVVQGLDRLWEVVLPASPPLPPFTEGRLRRETAQAAFDDSEARARPVVAAMNVQLAGQRDATRRALTTPAPKKTIDIENSAWDFFWHGTPVYRSQIRLGEFTSSVEARQREVIQQYRDRGVYDLYGRPFDYLNKRR